MFLPKEKIIWTDGPFNKTNKCYVQYDQNVQTYLLLWKYLKREIREFSIVNKILQNMIDDIENVHQNTIDFCIYTNNMMTPCRFCQLCKYHYISLFPII